MAEIGAFRLSRTGAPDVLEWVPGDSAPAPDKGQALVHHHAVGINYIDVYHRTGKYALPLPSGLGVEGAGVVTAVGEGVTEVAVGDRVAYAGGAPGSYATDRVIAADRLVRLPDGVSFDDAAVTIFKGLTVEYLVRRLTTLNAGDTVLFHAAAGGVGLIACQWLKHLGVTVIGTVSSDEKAALARANGCTHTIVYTREDVVARVKEITGGKGVKVAYDSVGKDTWAGSLDSLSPRGLFVSFGGASGPVPPIDLDMTRNKGSLMITRPTIATFIADRGELVTAADALFDLMAKGVIKPTIGGRYTLTDAAQAHTDLEARRTTGSLILTV